MAGNGRQMEYFWKKAKLNELSGCLEWTGNVKVGKYPYGIFYWIEKRKHLTAHRMAWMLLKGNISKGLCVMHTCDNPRCINVEHMRLGTHQENMRDRDEKGRSAKGVRQHLAKLNEDLVREIRASSESGETIAKRLGLYRSTVNRVRSRKTWKHI